MKKLKCPEGLSPKAKTLWHDLTTEYQITDSGGLCILEAGLRSFDRAETARKLIAKKGMVIFDRFGQAKSNPVLSSERDARSQWLMALKHLNLDFEGK